MSSLVPGFDSHSRGHHHDLLNVTWRKVVMADILGWFDARAPAASQIG
jgi:hypothetical protein